MAKSAKEIGEKVAEDTTPKAAAPTYTVIHQFNDKHNFATIYRIGQDVSHFNEARLQELISKGLVEKK